ncbi:MAG: hypothetical protein V3U58_01635 [Thermodesulfobacteriota bacterium]
MANDDKIEFELLENGLDFIISGLEYITSKSPTKRDLKYCVLHLYSGIELILKERLMREHWSLIFAQINNANKEDLKTCDFKSVGLEDSINRLKNICGISLDPKEAKHLIAFRKKRNMLEHYAIKDSEESLKSALSKLLKIIIDFLSNEIPPDNLTSEENYMIKTIRSKLSYFDEFVQERSAEIHTQLEEVDKEPYRYRVECPFCYEEALIVGDGNPPKCLFCGYTSEVEDVVKEFMDSVMSINSFMLLKDGGELPLHDCPECGLDALVEYYNFFPKKYVCFSCGQNWGESEISDCMSCGRLYDPGVHDSPMCVTCIEIRMEKDK